jgi:hypothetical protein
VYETTPEWEYIQTAFGILGSRIVTVVGRGVDVVFGGSRSSIRWRKPHE